MRSRVRQRWKRSRLLAANVAEALLRPASWAVVIVLFLITVGLGTTGLLVRQHDIARIERDELYTRSRQVSAAPAQVCLLDLLRNARPLLTHDPMTLAPLDAYLRLQGDHYPGVVCPLE